MAADWELPTLTSAYADLLSQLKARDNDCRLIATNLAMRNFVARDSADDTKSWSAIEWCGGTIQKFVSADHSGNTQYSVDGRTWTAGGTHATTCQPNSMAYSPTLDMVVAAGSGTKIAYSTNGTTWTLGATIASAYIDEVTWSETEAIFVAVGLSGVCLTSTDGINWTLRTTPNTNWWKSVTYSDTLDMWVAVANTGTNRVCKSTDSGVTWQEHSVTANGWQCVTWSEELGLFVAGGQTGKLMTSTNGTTWTDQTDIVGSYNSAYIEWSQMFGIFCMISNGAGQDILHSRDGINWFASDSPDINFAPLGLCFSEELALFASCAQIGGDRIWTSG